MVRRFLVSGVLLIAVLIVYTGQAFPDVKPRILVLPFEIHAKKDLEYLKNGIPEIVSNQLKKEGAVLLDPGRVTSDDPTTAFSVAKVAEYGASVSADHVVWGSFTRIGRKISLDAKLLDMSAQKQVVHLYAEGDGIDNLAGAVNSIAMDIGISVFGFETIATVVVKGNKRIEADAIAQVIKVKSGDRYQKSRLSKDLESIYNMGYFDDIRIEAERVPETDGGGVKIVFTVKEKPTIKKLRFKGNKAFSTEKIEKELTISLGSILNSNKIKSNIKQIDSLYVEKHYYNTKINYKTYPQKNNQVILEFIIEEGEKVRIKEINFLGNTAVKSKKLRKLMKTKQKGFFTWLSSSDSLDMADLNTDMAIVGADYQKKGFIDIKIGEPEIKYEGKWIYITVKVEEGLQYKTGKVDFSGDLILTKEEHLKLLTIKDEKYCNKEMIQKDIIALTDIFSDKGYANVDVNPRLIRDPFKKTADVVYHVNKGKQVYFGKIIIGGNTVTRDKVIRRELHVFEEELYSGSKLKRSVRNLYRLDYFQDVKINKSAVPGEDKVNLIIGVDEKPTGTFTFGMGYSSQDKFFGTLAVSKRNLFGRSQTLNLEAEFGEKAEKYSINFTEPWLFDIPLYSKAELSNWKREYDQYDKNTLGGGLTLGYPIFDYTTYYTSYSYEVNTINNIAKDAASDVTNLEGDNVTRSVTNTIRYDSRDRRYNAQATEGANHSISAEYTGGFLGGEIHYSKYKLTLGYYQPLPFGFIGAGHSEFGFIQKNGGSEFLPDYEKFYLGGANSVRGFKWHDIYALDEDFKEVGGEQMAQFNFELLRPLFGTEGFLGVLFHDLGQVYTKDDAMDLNIMRRSWGFGIRWYSPLGPIRFERGYIMDRKADEPSARWDFNMGGSF